MLLLYFLCIFEVRRVHQKRLLPVLVIFSEDSNGLSASMVRRWFNTIALAQCGAILCRVSAVWYEDKVLTLRPEAISRHLLESRLLMKIEETVLVWPSPFVHRPLPIARVYVSRRMK